MKNRQNRYITTALCVMLLAATAFGGCGKQETVSHSGSEQIELLEPVGSTATYEEAMHRNLYKSRVYSASVFPYTVEYSFAVGGDVEYILKMPGESVKKKETLAKLNMEALEKEIEAKEEYIQNMEENYLEIILNAEKYIDSKQGEYNNNKWAKEAYERVEPAAFVPSAGYESDPTADPAYATWLAEYNAWKTQYDRWNGNFRIVEHDINMKKESMAQTTALHELDLAYQKTLLKNLKDQRSDRVVTSGMKGKVVSINLLMNGNRLSSEQAVVAVGDESRKILKCEYITNALLNKAEEVYALIDGVRYEVKYEVMDSQTYTELTAQGETVYSTFEIVDPSEEIQMGDFAVVVLMEKRAENVLSVSKSAIQKDEYGSYVYVLTEDGRRELRAIEVGMTDGLYTEVKDGLVKGDKVLVNENRKVGSKTQTLKKGMSSNTFDGYGYIYYSTSEMETNPIEYGTTYIGEILIKQYQEVKKGDVIATVRVVRDEVELSRQEQKLTRLKERLADFDEQNKDKKDDENYLEAREQRLEAIAELEELIADMKADGKTKEIKATKNGIAIWVSGHKVEDIIYHGENLVEVADAGSCYIIVENTNQLLNYGNEVTVSYTTLEGQKLTTPATVANLSKMGVSNALATDYSLLLLPEEIAQSVAATQTGANNWWSRTRFGTSATVRVMENVVLVPKKAVWLVDGNTYVHVMNDNGEVVATSFVAGGFNDQYYWVIEGLTEGMNVCLE